MKLLAATFMYGDIIGGDVIGGDIFVRRHYCMATFLYGDIICGDIFAATFLTRHFDAIPSNIPYKLSSMKRTPKVFLTC